MTRTYSWCSKRCLASSLMCLGKSLAERSVKKKTFDYMASDLCQPIIDNAQHVLVWWCANQLQSALLSRWLIKLVESFNQQNVSLELPGLDSISHLSSTRFFCHSFLFILYFPDDHSFRSSSHIWEEEEHHHFVLNQQQQQQQHQQQNIFAPAKNRMAATQQHNRYIFFLCNKKMKSHCLEPQRGLPILGPY